MEGTLLFKISMTFLFFGLAGVAASLVWQAWINP
mgnify:CR=1 FL=1